ncbi:MAG: hypothetical protein MI747_01395 [Desulfobacterales bacterium]|nr:hypothetical protein [Desulfobacterales bacterium]
MQSAEIPVKTFYVRYDMKTEGHYPTRENLLMVPADQEFRGENFSVIQRRGVIPMTPQESKSSLELQARDTSLRETLRERGLKSVKSLNLVTIVSYEGLVRTPVHIHRVFDSTQTDVFGYKASFEFAPMAFPDQWRQLKNKYVIQKKLNDFLSLFH